MTRHNALTAILAVTLSCVACAACVGCEKQTPAKKDEIAGLLGSGKRDERGQPGSAPATLSSAERATLLKLARRSLVASVTGTWPRALTDGLSIGARLKRRQGAFVTLKKQGRLRGCIGTIGPRLPLYQAVIKNAQNAALYDSRFRQVTVDELQDIEVEISALSVPRRVGSYRDIVVGLHGVILQQGHGSATFLPHVATEQKWDRATTLTKLSRKAGLPGDAWKNPQTELQVYTAEVWSEKGAH